MRLTNRGFGDILTVVIELRLNTWVHWANALQFLVQRRYRCRGVAVHLDAVALQDRCERRSVNRHFFFALFSSCPFLLGNVAKLAELRFLLGCRVWMRLK